MTALDRLCSRCPTFTAALFCYGFMPALFVYILARFLTD